MRVADIIVGVNVDEHAQDLLRYAAFLNGIYRAHLHILHVIPHLEYGDKLLQAGWSNLEIEEALKKQAERDFKKLSHELKLSPTTAIFGGDPVRGITSYTHKSRAPITVLGSSPLSREWTSGFKETVSWGVIRASKNPVLVAPANFLKKKTFKLERLLCAVDFSASSQKALLWAADFHKRIKSKISVLNVLPNFNRWLLKEEADRTLEKTIKNLNHLVMNKLKNWIKESIELKRVQVILEPGEPVLEITQYAKNYDLLLMGAKGFSYQDAFALGGITGKVLQLSPIPILVVK